VTDDIGPNDFGRGRNASAIWAMMGFLRFSGLRRTTTNRLRRSTIVVTLAGPNFWRKWTKSVDHLAALPAAQRD